MMSKQKKSEFIVTKKGMKGAQEINRTTILWFDVSYGFQWLPFFPQRNPLVVTYRVCDTMLQNFYWECVPFQVMYHLQYIYLSYQREKVTLLTCLVLQSTHTPLDKYVVSFKDTKHPESSRYKSIVYEQQIPGNVVHRLLDLSPSW